MAIDYTTAWNDGYNAALEDIWAAADTLIDESSEEYAGVLADFLESLQSKI